MEKTDLLQSYEKDFNDCMDLLRKVLDDADPAAMIEKNQYALDDAGQLLKQIDIEAMNFMGDDAVRKRISKHKSDYDKIRKQIRKIQQQAAKRNVNGDSIELEDLET